MMLSLCRSDSETAGGGSVQEDQVGTGGVHDHCLREWSGPPINSHLMTSTLVIVQYFLFSYYNYLYDWVKVGLHNYVSLKLD